MAEVLTPQIEKLSARLEPKAPEHVAAPAASAKATERAAASAAASKARQAQSLQQGDASKRGNP